MSFTERRQRVTDTDGVLFLLEITSPAFTGPAYLVNDTRDWISNSTTYIGVPFGIRLPDDITGQSPKAQLVMTNVGTGITQELERLGPQDTVMARIKVTDRANPNVIEYSYAMPMTKVSVSGVTATAELGVDFIMRQQAVKLRATPFLLPGIFQ